MQEQDHSLFTDTISCSKKRSEKYRYATRSDPENEQDHYETARFRRCIHLTIVCYLQIEDEIKTLWLNLNQSHKYSRTLKNYMQSFKENVSQMTEKCHDSFQG